MLVGKWTWEEFQTLPRTELTIDIHCVTKWSKLGTVWEGLPLTTCSRRRASRCSPAPYLMAHCDGGYTSNLPLEDLLDGKGLVATRFDDQPLAPEHGGPARSRPAPRPPGKSVKWVRSLRFMEDDEPGFWSPLGYHIYRRPLA